MDKKMHPVKVNGTLNMFPCNKQFVPHFLIRKNYKTYKLKYVFTELNNGSTFSPDHNYQTMYLFNYFNASLFT